MGSGNRVYLIRVSRVRIPLSPPKAAPFRGGGIGNHRPEGGIFGQLHCHRREEYRSGYASLLFRASAANPPPSGAQRPFPSHLFRRKAGGRRQGGSPSKAGQHSAGANGAEMDRCFPMSPPLSGAVFLCALFSYGPPAEAQGPWPAVASSKLLRAYLRRCRAMNPRRPWRIC